MDKSIQNLCAVAAAFWAAISTMNSILSELNGATVKESILGFPIEEIRILIFCIAIVWLASLNWGIVKSLLTRREQIRRLEEAEKKEAEYKKNLARVRNYNMPAVDALNHIAKHSALALLLCPKDPIPEAFSALKRAAYDGRLLIGVYKSPHIETIPLQELDILTFSLESVQIKGGDSPEVVGISLNVGKNIIYRTFLLDTDEVLKLWPIKALQ